jgi:hypothetical protein
MLHSNIGRLGANRRLIGLFPTVQHFPAVLVTTLSQPFTSSAINLPIGARQAMQVAQQQQAAAAQRTAASSSVKLVSSPVNLSVGPRQAMQVALSKQQQLLLLFSCL